MSSRMRQLLRLPSRIAMLFGLGAMSVAAAHAAPSGEPQPAGDRLPQQSAKSFGDLRVWRDGDRLFAAEPGKAPEELRLGDTAEARALRELLARAGASAASPIELRDRLILVGGGGLGTHWSPQDKLVPPDNATAVPKTTNPPGAATPRPGAAATPPNAPSNLARAERKQ
jgi:hypothetical protein